MHKKKLVFSAACMGMLLFGIGLITLGAVVPGLKEKFHLDAISSGTLFSILPFGILTGSLLFGPLCDKYGYKILLAISCIFMFIGFEGIAYAPLQNILKICVFIFGLGGGAINGATNAIVSDISDKDKGANLSLLGVFFGIGALGMPLLLGVLEHQFNFETILAAVGIFTLLIGLFIVIIKFPPPKQAQGFPVAHSLSLIKDGALILIAFFLFCQSSFEGIINNWTTTYLINELSASQSHALFALSLFVAGMTVMRLLIGSIFRSVAANKILFISFGIIFIACCLLKIAHSFNLAVAGFILLGAGLAAGFPVMLGFVGDRFKALSGTAFSIVLVVALAGNMIINYAMGIIAHAYGIHNLINVTFAELAAMIILCVFILRKLKSKL